MKTWKEVEARFDDDDYDDRYENAAQRAAVEELSASELAEALRAVRGCGCCVNGGALNLRSAVLARIEEVLQEVGDR